MSEVKRVFHKYLHIEDDTILDIAFGCYVGNRLDTDPLWILNIAAPSNMKTELLRAFDGYKHSYFISSFTPQTLISGKKIGKKSAKDTSLLFKLNDKFVVCKDFGTILSMRFETRAEILAQLRECFDGQYCKAFGTGESIEWTGKFGFIGGCTPAYDKHHGVIDSMGERFLLVRGGRSNGASMGTRAQSIFGQEVKMREEIKAASHRFLDQFERLDNITFKKDEEVNIQIVALACFIALGRCPVERDRGDQHILYQPEPEGTPRLVKQFMQLGTGIALTQGRDSIDENVYQILKRVGCDQLPVQRLKILKFLWDESAVEFQSQWKATKEVAAGVNMPTSTTRLILEDFMIIGVTNRSSENEDSQTSAYLWQLSNEISEYIGAAEIFL
jgi:hypothetical protein